MKNRIQSLKELKTKIIICVSLMSVFILSFFFAKPLENFLGLNFKFNKNEVSAEALKNSNFEVTYIDVGQGNSCFVRFPDDKVMLIDGGTEQYANKVVDFLKSKNVETIDYLIATHADSDHIGGLSKVVETFDIKNFYRPFQIAGTGTSAATFVANPYEDLAGVYEDLMIQTNNRSKISRVTTPDFNLFVELMYKETYIENSEEVESLVTVFYDDLVIAGEGYKVEFFAPLKRDLSQSIEDNSSRTKGEITVGYGTTDSNNNSAIFLLSVFDYSFLFTGDATWRNKNTQNKAGSFEETDFLLSLSKEDKQKLQNLDVVLAGHHGSSYSTSAELLNLTAPRFVVISVGAGNNFGHPSSEVIFRAESTKRVEVDYLLRTDKNGTITFGKTDQTLCYAVEENQVLSELSISWIELSILIFVSLMMCVIFIKPIRSRKVNFIDTKI